MPLISLKGIILNYEVFGDLNAEQTPLVFIHGLGSSLRDWEKQTAYFKPQFPIIVFDLRGHGQSEKPDVPYTVNMFTEDTVQLLNAIVKRKCHIVGLSLGGMIAFQLAVDYPQLCQSISIVNSAPAVTFPSLKVFINFYLRKFSVKLFGMKRLSVSLAHMLLPKPEQADLRKTFIERWNENDPHAYLNSLNAFHDWNLMDRIPEINCPTLVIASDQDYTPVSYKMMYCNLIPHSRLVIIPDSRHLAPVDQTQLFNHALSEFLLGAANATTK